MPEHPLFGGKTSRQVKNPNAPEQGQYVAQVYVNRRKMWEERYQSEDQAWSAAKHEKTKYQGQDQDPVTIVRKAK